MKNYYLSDIGELFSVTKIATCFYTSITDKAYLTPEEHDFWELVYVDSGEVNAWCDGITHSAHTGDAVFYPPNASHDETCHGAAALGIVSFVCESPAMEYFKQNPCFSPDSFERSLISSILNESIKCFDTVDEDGYCGMRALPNARADSLQLIKLMLEHILIRLFRRKNTLDVSQLVVENDMLWRIKSYLKNSLCKSVTVSDICSEFSISASFLKKLFKNGTGGGAIEWFNAQKIEYAKSLIRDGKRTVSEISALLSFSAPDYFSRAFKKATGISPSEYSKSVKP